MDFGTLLGFLSPVAGFLGSVIQKGFGIYEERQRHKNEMEKLELASRIDVQKADLALREVEKRMAGEAFTEAIKAQANLQAASRGARDFIALFRPGLTTLVLVASLLHATYLIYRGADATEFWRGIHSLASMSFGYWFGIRTFEKASEVRLAAPIKK